MLKLIVGCGYLGLRVARSWLADGHHVVGVTRTQQRARQLEIQGIEPLVCDVVKGVMRTAWPTADTVLWAIGFDRSDGQTIHDVYVGGLRNLVGATIPQAAQRMIYVSSTGVYGQNHGQWVDENDLCDPRRAGGRACLAAEQLLRAERWGGRLTVLRLAGLYGPDRIPRVGQLRRGGPIGVVDGFLNLIHVDDAVSAIRCADRGTDQGDTYNVSDGHPVARKDYFRELARLVQAPPPRFVKPDSGSQAALRASSNKRVNSQRIRDRLGFVPRYATFKNGLSAIVGQSSTG